MKKLKSHNSFYISLLVFFYCGIAIGQNNEKSNYELSISSSNDAFLIIGDDLDRFYSFGFGASLKIKDHHILGLEKLFSDKIGFYTEIGLRIEGYTPTDKAVSIFEIETNSIAFDRPFAGVTYGTLGMNYVFKRSSFQTVILLGLIGENSLAGDIQTWFHKNITNDETFKEEWVYQVPNQLLFNISAQYTYDLTPKSEWIDIFTSGQFLLGNYRINATPSLGVRIGKFEKISESIGFNNNILGDDHKFELFLQSTFSITRNFFDATAQRNIFSRNFEFEVEELNSFHSTFTHSIFLDYKMFSMGYTQYFTRGVTLKDAQHSYGKILLKYRF